VSLKSLAFVFLPMCALAQWPPFEDGASLNQIDGRAAADRTQPDAANRFRFERFDSTNEPSLELNGNPPLMAEPSEREQAKPISGVISLRQLQHPPSKKAIRLFQEAQRYSQAHDTAKAIGKLEEAIHIAPSFAEAHQNLGVQYARSGRTGEAITQFETVLEIGPPDAKAYSNLGWAMSGLDNSAKPRISPEERSRSTRITPLRGPCCKWLPTTSALAARAVLHGSFHMVIRPANW
jgi:tetratricopeptide (TPR) repeat protein